MNSNDMNPYCLNFCIEAAGNNKYVSCSVKLSYYLDFYIDAIQRFQVITSLSPPNFLNVWTLFSACRK